ncbi:MAG: type II toxin-antitoxin system PemK/MazF family toxin, partial [Bacilli bacterium]|nr:type II toxin-antitoxin system PemK/MazF family toxin [Bacilli bacterium]
FDSEQRGIRPALVVQNDMGNKNSSTISVAPLTSKKKNKLPVHIELKVEDGMKMDSIICIEQTRVVSKRRLFYNGFPIKIMKLSDERIFEVNVAIEKQFGISDIMYDRTHSFKLVEQIKALESNIRVKQSRDLIDIFNAKIEELAIYCKKYSRNIESVMNEYESNNSYVCVI